MFNDDKQHGVMLGGEWPNIKVTSNGGNNWISVNTGTDIYDFCTASWVSGTNTVFICASSSPSNNKIIRSDNNGLTWQQQSTPNLAIQELDNISYGNKFVGFAITNEGYVLKSIQNVIPVLPQDTIRVPTDYSTIQAGIDAAQNGNIVLVDDGTYLENINFKGKAITVASRFLVDSLESHIENTIIDGSQPSNPDSGSVVTFNSGEDTTSVLCGFTITGGTGTYYPPGVLPVPIRIGGGILCFNSAATIKNNKIKYNSLEIGLPDAFTMGGGIFCGPPIPGLYTIIKKNIIYGNSILTTGSASNWQMSWSQGGGLMILYDGLVSENNIYSNHCKSIDGYGVGGGIRLLGGTTKIINNNIDFNSSISINSRGFAGGISCSAANTIIDSDTITNNYVSGALGCRGAAIYFDLDNDAYWAVVKNNYISGNYHTNGICYGGAIGMYTSSPDVYNNVITNNSANYGGALSALDNSKPKIINNTITNNTAIQSGGALYLEDLTTNPIIINSILWNNGTEIYLDGGTVTVNYSDIEGGYTGIGNIDSDPIFVSGDTLYHLQQN